MKKLLTAGIFFIATGSGQLLADTALNFRFSEDSIKATITTAPLITESTSGEASWLYNDDKDANVANLGFFVNGTRAELSGRAGIKAYGAKIDKDEGGGFAFGGDGALRINEIITAFASVYLGPSYVSFNDVESYREWRVGFDFALFKNIILSASYGELTIETDRYNKSDIEDGLAIGLKMSF